MGNVIIRVEAQGFAILLNRGLRVVARSAEEKLRAYWAMEGAPPAERQGHLLAKLAEVERKGAESSGITTYCR